VWVLARGCVIVATMLRLASAIALASLVACSGAPKPSPRPAPPSAPAPTTAHDPVSSAPGTTPVPTSPAPPTSPPKTPVRVDDSDPAGMAPLTEEESAEMKKDCGTYTQAMARKVEAANRLEGTVKLLEAIKDDTSNPRCKTLLQRDLGAFLARSRESTAMNDIRMIMVGMSQAYDHNGTLCPPAPPVPERVEVLSGGFIAPDAAYDAEAWSCSGFHLHGRPQFYQYEVKRVDDTHFEILARGYPVPGGELSVLSLKGEVKDGAVPLHSNVYRH